ncbi:MAG: rhodanese-like domain-containing protein [Casimicrobiaceae bacterium]
MSAQDAEQRARARKVPILDVRDDAEWQEGHIPGALHTYVGDLGDRLRDLPKGEPLIVHCTVGNRAGLAASILQRAGFERVYNLLGGFRAWSALGLPTTSVERDSA